MITARQLLAFSLLLFIILTCAGAAPATTPAGSGASAQAFDVKGAVNAYLAKMPASQRERSNSYFEGGYWLILVDFLYTAIIMLLLLQFRWSARMRGVAERITGLRYLQTAIYWIQFLVVTFLLTFPLTLYEGYFRERKYGLLNQAFGPWLRDRFVLLLAGLILGAILVVPLIAIVRRLGKSWWVWGAALSIVFIVFVSLIEPVYISPLFNKYKKLEDPRIREPILSMARANGIPASEVYEFNASRQSNRISAHVSGFANTLRISSMTTISTAVPCPRSKPPWGTRWAITSSIMSTRVW
jgi:CAAX prenyl protease N-terminal, five membrane helices